MSDNPKNVIGIDLGTTNSCVAVFKKVNGVEKVQIIPSQTGHRTMPSVVAFTENERLIGDVACSQASYNPKNTIFHVKRLIGRKLNEPEIMEDKKHFPFQLVSKKSKIGVEVDFRNSRRFFTPEEISAMILQKMKITAEKYLDRDVTDAVITVPAYFNDGQRQATKDAATIAGLNAIRIINEPTAAALAYGLENVSNGEKDVLVFDLGGGTFDVSIVNIKEGPVFEVKATTGDTHLGGADFDQKLIQFCIDKIRTDHSIDISNNSRAIVRLRKECEDAKKLLSTSTRSLIEVNAISDGIDFNTNISRSTFEELCTDLFDKIINVLEKSLEDAKLEKSEIDDVVLVGGSTRIPKIQRMLEEFFEGKALKSSINPDEAVAYGAATQAALSFGLIDRTCILRDVTPLSLGLQTNGGVMTNIINRNTVIPITVTRTFTTFVDNQEAVMVQVYEGENPMIKDNKLLGKFELDNIPLAPRGVPSIDVTFSVDLNGILEVNACETTNGRTRCLVVKNQNGRLSAEDLTRMTEEAEEFRREEEARLGEL